MKKLTTIVTAFVATYGVSAVAFAEDLAASSAGGTDMKPLAFGFAALACALAAFGGALGQGRAASAALEGIGRNPSAAGQIQTPMILALAFTEALTILTFLLGFLFMGKVA